ncbi:MAG TPA: hypothetical protein VFQ91_12970 [Bryobacteraceae bacterium]|nr:hypothetical protein [Bryobacteraceae bacterium]
MRLLPFFFLLPVFAFAQTFSPLNCAASAVPSLIRYEGLAERVGDVVLNCVGGTPNGRVRGDLRVISYGGNITNKRSTATGNLDAVLTVDVGSGPQSSGASAELRGNNQFDFTGIDFLLGPEGTANLRITNIRVASPLSTEEPMQLGFATNGQLTIRVETHPLTVAITTRGLLGAYSSAFICTVSPLPSEISFATLLAQGTRYASMRFTEGFSEAFLRKIAPADQGTRLLVRFSGFPEGARLFVPDALAGSSATLPTAAGDLGLAAHGGRYDASAGGQLLMVRVRNTDENGAAGVLLPFPTTGTTDLNGVSEVPLVAGAGVAVYEVVDSNPAARETVQLPIFLGLEQRPAGGSVRASVAATFGPVSTVGIASGDPAPRYRAIAPPSDCQALGDCNSGIFPKLAVETEGLLYNPVIGQFAQSRYIRVRNDGGGLLNWAASVQYKNGSGWLTLDPASGVGNGTIRLDATAAGLAAGVYEATLTVDAGPLAGTVTLPVRMEAREFGSNPMLPPEVSSIVHAATFERAALAPGTIATLFGNRLRGEKVEVRVSDLPARIFFGNDTQINFEVPATLPMSGTVNLFVTVDTKNSPARTLSLAPASPGIFPNAVLNQDNTVNTAETPATAGTAIQIFLTGLPASVAPVTVKIHDYTVTPSYAGSGPGFIGLQQVNAIIPGSLQAITSNVAVCTGAVCSPGRPITVRRP